MAYAKRPLGSFETGNFYLRMTTAKGKFQQCHAKWATCRNKKACNKSSELINKISELTLFAKEAGQHNFRDNVTGQWTRVSPATGYKVSPGQAWWCMALRNAESSAVRDNAGSFVVKEEHLAPCFTESVNMTTGQFNTAGGAKDWRMLLAYNFAKKVVIAKCVCAHPFWGRRQSNNRHVFESVLPSDWSWELEL